MKYRAEIDGLRSVAVLPVIFFHGGFAIFSGGYVGVDVFFVISGYLITTILIGDLDRGEFSILRFYERRARRILPALSVVMAACILPAFLWMLPHALRSFSQSLIAVSLFVSNIFFARGASYFGSASDEIPLLHTWSLAVEEQYYVIFPVLLFLLWPLGRRWAFALLALVALVSFGLSEYPLFDYPTKHFYFSPARAWELLFGSLCAFVLFYKPLRANDPMSLLGFGLILLSIFTFTEYTPFPSAYTLAPVLGTALIILYCDRGTWVGRLLSMKIPVGIGLISYSLYLWHQPLFAFARIRSKLPPGQPVMLALIAVTFGLAYLTWRYVEQPVRQRRVFATRTAVFAGSAAMMAAFITLGFIGHFQIVKGRWDVAPNTRYESLRDRKSDMGSICRAPVENTVTRFSACYFGDIDADRTVILYGDSHAEALSHRLRDRFVEEGIRGIHINGMPFCGVELLAFSTKTRDTSECERNFEELKALLRDHADAIILMSRWTQHLYPIDGMVEDLHYTNEAGVRENAYYYQEFFSLDANGDPSFDVGVKKAAAQKYVRELAAVGKPVVLIYPVPETAWNLYKLNAYDYNVLGKVPVDLSISAPRYLERNRLILDWFDELHADNLIKIKPLDLFCTTGPQGRCKIQEDTVPLYDDDDHLSYEGSRRVVDPVVDILKRRMR